MTHSTFTRASKSALDQRRRVLALFRDCLRNTTPICEMYAVNYPPSVVRKTIRFLFEKNLHLTGKDIDAALLKGQMELRETLMVWKQPTHVNRLIQQYLQHEKMSSKPKSGFLEGFIKGTLPK